MSSEKINYITRIIITLEGIEKIKKNLEKKNRQQRSETQLRHSAETKYHDSVTSEFCLNFHWFALLRT